MRFLHALLGLSVLAFFVTTAGSVVCESGSKWYDGCNLCTCVNRSAACSHVQCAPGNLRGKPWCANGSKWMPDGCNWCSCYNKIARCSRKLCPLGG
ncbi:U-reduvitoxin-Pr11a-like [Hyalella azteca]|uniref:U-reduvitoxin-Pr11a-like n=1 Tax=Hyalella azteca TaxID=294128 RepID=A0A8B7NGB9_HYAAZ|nr:U-reduvitoxin-Pr11a-like [Hyalella azteca]XP_047737370.1 U-reduvitoxin-Pr11a-like [Hyalella azteca]